MTTKNGQLVDSTGKALFFHGINWFGFDDGNTMVDGLWEGGPRVPLLAVVSMKLHAGSALGSEAAAGHESSHSARLYGGPCSCKMLLAGALRLGEG